MIEPQAVAAMTLGYAALESGDRTAHRLLSEVIDGLDAHGLGQVVETLVIAVTDLLSRLHEEHPGFDPDAWIQQFGLIAAGAR